MIIQILKFVVAIVLFISLILFALFSNEQSIRGVSIAFILFLALPILILIWRDTGSVFRQLGRQSPRFRIIGNILGYPQAERTKSKEPKGSDSIEIINFPWMGYRVCFQSSLTLLVFLRV